MRCGWQAHLLRRGFASGANGPMQKERKSMAIKQEQLTELLLQALEHERGGIQVYEAALRCAVNDDLIEEWEEYHEQTLTHAKLLEDVCQQLAIDLEQPSLGREIIRSLGAAL